MEIVLRPYQEEREQAVRLIRGFWKEHNGYDQNLEESLEDLRNWTQTGHGFFFILCDGEAVGFVHLGSRGAEADWLEDIYVERNWQNRGIGTRAIELVEEIVKTYSESLYIEAAARNERAIRLYRRIGYDCLNTITIRKDFFPEKYRTIGNETIYGERFAVKQNKN